VPNLQRAGQNTTHYSVTSIDEELTAVLEKGVFRTRLKVVLSVTVRTVSGREFQMVGPATEKALRSFADLRPSSRNQVVDQFNVNLQL